MPDLDYFQWGYHFKPTFCCNSVIQGTWAIYMNVLSYFNGSFPNAGSGAVNDEIQFKFGQKAGAYTFRLLCQTGLVYAIITIYIDGVSQGTIDLWSAGPNVYNVVKTLAVTIVKDGEHTLNIKATGTTGGTYYVATVGWWLTG